MVTPDGQNKQQRARARSVSKFEQQGTPSGARYGRPERKTSENRHRHYAPLADDRSDILVPKHIAEWRRKETMRLTPRPFFFLRRKTAGTFAHRYQLKVGFLH